jgi:hypothetical protein
MPRNPSSVPPTTFDINKYLPSPRYSVSSIMPSAPTPSLADRIRPASQGNAISTVAGPYAGWSFTELTTLGAGILTHLSQSLIGLLDAKGELFNDIFNHIERTSATLLTVQYLAAKLKPEEVNDEDNMEEEPTPRRRGPGRPRKQTQKQAQTQEEAQAQAQAERDDGDWLWDENEETATEVLDVDDIDMYHSYSTFNENHANRNHHHDIEFTFPTSLSADPDFAEWTSAQMLLHAAELRFEALGPRKDADAATTKKEMSGLEMKAKAIEADAREWQVEGERRKVLEGERKRVLWGPVVFEPMLMIEVVMRPWYLGLKGYESTGLEKGEFGH